MSEYRYRIRHLTAYRYTGRIDLCHSMAHLTPREDGGRQEVLASRVDIAPLPHFQVQRSDYFGNETRYFEIQGSHDSLEVVSTLTVVKRAEALPTAHSGLAWDDESNRPVAGDCDGQGRFVGDFLLPSAACPFVDSLDAFLAPSLQPGRDGLELAYELMGRIHSEFQYFPGATDTTTPLGELLERRQGVCQDFAHVMIAALRRIGMPVRYVSGYLETAPPPGQEKLQGADATHAWVEVYAPATGWIGFDPTNRMIPVHQHVKLAHGRDYFDVQPLKGLFMGSGSQELVVEVDVERF